MYDIDVFKINLNNIVLCAWMIGFSALKLWVCTYIHSILNECILYDANFISFYFCYKCLFLP